MAKTNRFAVYLERLEPVAATWRFFETRDEAIRFAQMTHHLEEWDVVKVYEQEHIATFQNREKMFQRGDSDALGG